MNENQDSPTQFEVFVLSYLFSQELSWRNDPVKSKITKTSPRLNVQELAIILPYSIAGDMEEDDIIQQLSILENKHFISVGMLGTSSEGFGSFSITTKGILLIKKIFGKLKNSIKDKKSYEEKIENLEGSTEVKNWLKGIWDSLKGKAQDEIADFILSQVKMYGIPLIVLTIELMRNSF